jgi:hypothetical protein
MSGAAAGLKDPSYIVDVWNGFADGPTSWWSAASSGHGQWTNATLKIDLAADAPAWVLVHPGSGAQYVTKDSAYYKDGLPVARHTYYSTQYIRSRNRVMLFGCMAPYGIGQAPPVYQGGPEVDGFNIVSGQWDTAGTWAKLPIGPNYGHVTSRHPITDDVYIATGYKFAKWNAANGAWSHISPSGNVQPLAWENYPALIDVKRNRWLSLHDGAPYYNVGVKRLQMIDLTSYALSELPISGDLASIPGYSMIVHDTDNDRYLLAADTRIYTIDPDTGVTKQIAIIPKASNGIFNKFSYFQALGGVAYLPQFSSNILFMPTR